jgi:signal transduction histidine kinase
LALVLATLALRTALLLAYRRAGPRERCRPGWERSAIAGIALSGLAWGGAIPLLAPPDSPLHQGFATLWVCGLAAGSVAALSPVRWAFFAFLLPATVPGALYLLGGETAPEITMGGGLLLFAGFLSFNALRMHRTVADSLRLELANGVLVADLAAEKARIERLNAELESRVAERTADLHAATDAKTRFLAATSHDLRQPLQMLSLLHAALGLKVGDPESRRILAKMGEGLGAMTDMLDALTEISRLKRGGIAPQIAAIPVERILARLGSELAPSALAKGLVFRVRPTSALVLSDERLLERILRNLLSNAIKYTATGKVLIGGRRRGQRLRLEVWDTGIGIPSDQLERIFEELCQLEGPNGRRGSGQGLGLAIVRGTADLLGHPLAVRSAPGKGSVFSLEVPLAGVGAAAQSRV